MAGAIQRPETPAETVRTKTAKPAVSERPSVLFSDLLSATETAFENPGKELASDAATQDTSDTNDDARKDDAIDLNNNENDDAQDDSSLSVEADQREREDESRKDETQTVGAEVRSENNQPRRESSTENNSRASVETREARPEGNADTSERTSEDEGTPVDAEGEELVEEQSEELVQSDDGDVDIDADAPETERTSQTTETSELDADAPEQPQATASDARPTRREGDAKTEVDFSQSSEAEEAPTELTAEPVEETAEQDADIETDLPADEEEAPTLESDEGDLSTELTSDDEGVEKSSRPQDSRADAKPDTPKTEVEFGNADADEVNAESRNQAREQALRPDAATIAAQQLAAASAANTSSSNQGVQATPTAQPQGVQATQAANSNADSGANNGFGEQGNKQAEKAARPATRTNFSRVLENRQHETIKQVAKAIGLRNAMSSQGRVSLLLNPEHLGTLKLELSFDKDGKLAVDAQADNIATRHLLAGQSDELRVALREHNIDLSRFNVEHHSNQNQHSQDSSASNQGGKEQRDASKAANGNGGTGQAEASGNEDNEEQSGPLKIGSVNVKA